MEIRVLRQPYKFIRRADKPLKEKIKEEVLRIKNNPNLGKKMKGSLYKNIFKHRFNFKKVSYRITYRIENNILIICISTRENYYRDLRI
ncbi:type II toxin-antitoxin system RelE/ParE family toxin [Candidatus Peregrinibacteria bacterium]|jgi:mRNA-degrading endonuclease RelE of RelBE toxin-antitoxin system|nr:type II toxin-antitoxin system RelE/ParE family toxin [Candidatus Peregrinibacteria bacterium]MBT4147694.1 type II toxin-antitoxin system RelE/ParE family toxin [Candidatus Peregrinibacteria bacterium]MBT4366301.1 type II toxin-antitoxin system RelE/ParE family toxin [Candidatus Peregrinibacteria bacterium]MBT4455822.1 type II toxin-antitoxin system RelE/ParE family toxin [Candidatus Peregrinibacteria bacterium]